MQCTRHWCLCRFLKIDFRGSRFQELNRKTKVVFRYQVVFTMVQRNLWIFAHHAKMLFKRMSFEFCASEELQGTASDRGLVKSGFWLGLKKVKTELQFQLQEQQSRWNEMMLFLLKMKPCLDRERTWGKEWHLAEFRDERRNCITSAMCTLCVAQLSPRQQIICSEACFQFGIFIGIQNCFCTQSKTVLVWWIEYGFHWLGQNCSDQENGKYFLHFCSF